MPATGGMPECPSAVIVAKPGREAWALEEAWDLAVIVSGRVEKTRFPGVMLLYSPLRGEKLVEALRRGPRNAFIKRIVVARACFRMGRVERLEGLPRRARLIVALRGSSKSMDYRSVIGVDYNDRRSQLVIDVEGVDDVIIVSWGRALSCGYDCLLVGGD